MQLVKMMSNQEIKLFIGLLDDLSHEIEEMGYKGYEVDLIEDIMFNHFGIEFECTNQLNMFAECIMKHQNKLESAVRGACLYVGKNIA